MFDQPIDLRENFPGRVNTAHDVIYANMRRNVRRPLPQIQPHAVNDYKAMILCGGPSLADHTQEIKRKRRQGWKIITVNGSHDWCLDHGMTPSLHVMIDARPFNVRFVQRPQEPCRYAIASQAAPDVFDALEGYDVHIFHCGASSPTEKRILDRRYLKRWMPVIGGTSVGTRALGLACMLGIRTVDVYGFDCCYRKGQHHAYEQPENDYRPEGTWRVRIGRRTFRADPWMVKQADEFYQMSQVLPDDLKLTIKGDGIVAYTIAEHAAGRNPKMRVL